MMTIPQITTSSQEALSPAKLALSANLISTASGTSSILMTVEVILSAMLQICGLATSRKEKTKVLPKSSLGSSASNPRPVIMLRTA